MSRVLVAYSTQSGSTAQVAEAVAAALQQQGHSAEARPVAQVRDLAGYDALVLGAPMIFGWQRAARRFLSLHRDELRTCKVALFACAMRLTRDPGKALSSPPLFIDPQLDAAPLKPGRLSLKERFTRVEYYLGPMLGAAPGVQPVSVAFFKGKLEMFTLSWWQAAFVLLVVQAPPGDYRAWDAIQSWAEAISRQLQAG